MDGEPIKPGVRRVAPAYRKRRRQAFENPDVS